MRAQSIRLTFDDDEDMRDIVVQLWHDGYSGSVVSCNTIEVLVDGRLDAECLLDMITSKELAKRL